MLVSFLCTNVSTQYSLLASPLPLSFIDKHIVYLCHLPDECSCALSSTFLFSVPFVWVDSLFILKNSPVSYKWDYTATYHLYGISADGISRSYGVIFLFLILSRSFHGVHPIFTNTRGSHFTGESSHEKPWTWLRKGNLKKEAESLLIAAENNVISTNLVKVKIAHVDFVEKKMKCLIHNKQIQQPQKY